MKVKADKKICELMNELENFKELQMDHSNNIEKLSNLYELGIVNEEGVYRVNEQENKNHKEIRIKYLILKNLHTNYLNLSFHFFWL